MNVSMCESTLVKLKIMVERAMRPVRASASFKRMMREKLLAEVQAVFEEEVIRLADEQAALERTTERFGFPPERTRQLQESVPAQDWIERLGEWLAYQPGEPTMRRAFRYIITIELAAIVFFIPFVLLLRRQMGEWPTEIIWHNCPVLFPVGYLGFTISVLEASIRSLLNGQKWSLWLGFALVVAGSAMVSILFGFLGFGMSVKTATWVPFFTVVFPLPLAWGLVHTFTLRKRYEEDWANLPLDTTGEN